MQFQLNGQLQMGRHGLAHFWRFGSSILVMDSRKHNTWYLNARAHIAFRRDHITVPEFIAHPDNIIFSRLKNMNFGLGWLAPPPDIVRKRS